ncbi:MAG TPA: hypothetical protein VKT73_07255 [Xanthobacteraceae bacterium]|jgi:hypothetical protein|nr:hypothetical protein [Xanthobacteraceae bacterium]
MNAEKKKWLRWILLNTVVAATLIWQIAAPGEAPSQALSIMEYFLLALALFSLAGSAVMFVKS